MEKDQLENYTCLLAHLYTDSHPEHIVNTVKHFLSPKFTNSYIKQCTSISPTLEAMCLAISTEANLWKPIDEQSLRTKSILIANFNETRQQHVDKRIEPLILLAQQAIKHLQECTSQEVQNLVLNNFPGKKVSAFVILRQFDFFIEWTKRETEHQKNIFIMKSLIAFDADTVFLQTAQELMKSLAPSDKKSVGLDCFAPKIHEYGCLTHEYRITYSKFATFCHGILAQEVMRREAADKQLVRHRSSVARVFKTLPQQPGPNAWRKGFARVLASEFEEGRLPQEMMSDPDRLMAYLKKKYRPASVKEQRSGAKPK